MRMDLELHVNVTAADTLSARGLVGSIRLSILRFPTRPGSAGREEQLARVCPRRQSPEALRLLSVTDCQTSRLARPGEYLRGQGLSHGGLFSNCWSDPRGFPEPRSTSCSFRTTGTGISPITVVHYRYAVKSMPPPLPRLSLSGEIEHPAPDGRGSDSEAWDATGGTVWLRIQNDALRPGRRGAAQPMNVASAPACGFKGQTQQLLDCQEPAPFHRLPFAPENVRPLT